MKTITVTVELDVEIDDRSRANFTLTDATLADRVRVDMTSRLIDWADGEDDVTIGEVWIEKRG